MQYIILSFGMCQEQEDYDPDPEWKKAGAREHDAPNLEWNEVGVRVPDDLEWKEAAVRRHEPE